MVFETKVSTGVGTSGTEEESSTKIALKDMILKAFRDNPSLPLDIQSLIIEPFTQNHFKDLPTNRPRALPGIISTQTAVSISEDTTKSINISEEAAATNGFQGRDEKAIQNTFPTQKTSKHLAIVTTLVTNTEPPPPEPSGGPRLKEEQNLITKAEGNVLFISILKIQLAGHNSLFPKAFNKCNRLLNAK